MKNSIVTKRLLLILVLLSSGFYTLSAQDYAMRDCNEQCSWISNCLRLPGFDCGRLNLQVQAGIAPIVWAKRGSFQVVSCNVASNNCQGATCGPILPVFKMPKFHHLYKLPWTVGGKVGYALNDCSELYIEANYRQAKGKNCFNACSNIDVGTFIANTNFGFSNISKYSLFDVYLGVRTALDLNFCWCNSLNGFVGMQVGLAHHKSSKADITTSSTSNTCAAPFTASCVQLFGKHTAVAAGANIGFEYCVGCGFSLVFTAEMIATCGPNGNSNFAFDGCTADIALPEIAPSNFIVGSIGTELLFPITLGLKYNF